ncbi:MAG: glycosyltransferase family 2 protein, partial [Thiohalomonadales bacterium]
MAQCVLSILNNTPNISFEIIVVDNASHDGSSQYIQENYEQVRLIVNDSNLGFSKGNNVGIQATKGKYVLLLNSDTIVIQGAMDVLVDYLDARSDVAAVGPMLLNKDLTIQRSWFDFPSVAKTFSHILGLSRLIYKVASYQYVSTVFSYLGFEPAFMKRDFNKPARVDYLIFACVLIRRTLFEEMGLLDEGLFFYHEDYEFGYRMYTLGLRLHYLPNAKIIHLGGGTSTKYLLKTYRENFRGIFYVYGKYHGAVRN